MQASPMKFFRVLDETLAHCSSQLLANQVASHLQLAIHLEIILG